MLSQELYTPSYCNHHSLCYIKNIQVRKTNMEITQIKNNCYRVRVRRHNGSSDYYGKNRVTLLESAFEDLMKEQNEK